MALRTPPSWLQNGIHPAENDRLSMQAVYATSGIVGSTSLAVTQAGTPAMAVQVATGWGAIVGDYTTNMGAYQFYNDAATQLTITAANVTNPRIDRVVVTINDSYYTGTTNNVTFTVVAGTPAASPTAPATPTNSISLATVAVAANATSITNANITDTRSIATTNLPQAMTILASGSLSGSSVALTSISGSYKNLQLVIRDCAIDIDGAALRLRLNNDSNTRYAGTTATYSSGLSFNATYVEITYLDDDTVAEGLTIIDIYDYANTSTWKMFLSNAVSVNSTTTTQYNIVRQAGLYNQTGAITQINLLPSSGSFNSGTYILYGVK